MLGASQALVLALSFATWVHLARTLAPEGFGVLSFGTALLAYFLLVVVLGFEVVGMREVARDPSRAPALVAHILGMRLVLWVGAAALYGAVLLVLPQPPLYKGVLLVLGLNLLVRATQLNWVFVGLEEVGAQAVRDVGAAVLTAGAALALVRGPGDLVAAAAATVVPPLLGNAYLLAVFVRRHGRLRLRFDRAAWGALLVPALPLAASAFLSEVYYSLDKVMLEFMRSTEEVGLYGAAYKLLTLALAPSFVLYQAFFPSLSSAYGDPAAMRARANVFARVMAAVGLPLLAAGPFLAGDGITFVFGAEYAPAGPALALLLVNAGIVYVAMSFGNPLMAWNLQRPYMKAIAVGAVANVILNVALIPPFGILGAAVATAASEAVVLAGLIRVYVRAVGFDLGAFYLRAGVAALLGAALPAAACAYVGAPFLAGVAAVVVGYGLAGWWLGVIDRTWLDVLRPAGRPAAASDAAAAAAATVHPTPAP